MQGKVARHFGLCAAADFGKVRAPMFLRILPLLAALASASLAADWPQWRGPLRTGEIPASEPVPQTLPAEPKTVWRLPAARNLLFTAPRRKRVGRRAVPGSERVCHKNLSLYLYLCLLSVLSSLCQC